jgi:hypothetical protein
MFRFFFLYILLLFKITVCNSQNSNAFKVCFDSSDKKMSGAIFIYEYAPNPNEFYKEFIRILDSAKNFTYSERLLVKENLIVNRWFNFKTYFDTMGSLACRHHNKYMFEMAKHKIHFLSHEEKNNHPIIYGSKINEDDFNLITLIDTVIYSGKDSLIDNFSDRALYYSKNTFASIGECCFNDKIPRIDFTDKDLAYYVFKEFKKSKLYWNILMNDTYSSIAIDLLSDPLTNRFWVTINVGFSKNHNDSYKYNYDLNNLIIIKDLNKKKKNKLFSNFMKLN